MYRPQTLVLRKLVWVSEEFWISSNDESLAYQDNGATLRLWRRTMVRNFLIVWKEWTSPDYSWMLARDKQLYIDASVLEKKSCNTRFQRKLKIFFLILIRACPSMMQSFLFAIINTTSIVILFGCFMEQFFVIFSSEKS